MLRVLCIAAGLAAAPLVTKARSAPDAGTTVTTAATVAATDGGVPKAAAPRAGPSADAVEAMRLRVEMAELQQRMLALEQNAERERQQNEQLQKVVQQLQSIREEQQAAADTRLQNERAAAERAAQVRAAVGGLMSAVQQLTTGDTNIGWALDAAQSAPIGPSAQKNLQLARSALYNEDLSVAGGYLAQAISDAQAYGAR